MFDISRPRILKTLAARDKKLDVGIVGMRVNARTKAADQLAHYVGQLGLPVIWLFA